MKKVGIIGLLAIFILTIFLGTSCTRGTISTRNHFAHDRNVASWRKGKHKYKKRRRAYTSKRYNRGPLNR